MASYLNRFCAFQEGDMATLVSRLSDPTIFQKWQSIAAILHEQATQLGLTTEDRRDAAYWEIVEPLFVETDRMMHLA